MVKRLTIRNVGERELIRRFQRLITPSANSLLVENEDAVAIGVEKHAVIINTDMLVASTDVLPSMTPAEIAWKAGVMGLSDLAAKGATPYGIVVSLGLPSEMEAAYASALVSGLDYVCREHDTYYLGGDTNQCLELVINCTAIGITPRTKLVYRSGAEPGDIVAVTGKFGYTGALFEILLKRRKTPKHILNEIRQRALQPRARLVEGQSLANAGIVSASIDSSDGLAWSLHELASASHVGFRIDHLPIPDTCLEFAKLHTLDAENLALYGGEEFELVVTIPHNQWSKATETVQRIGGHLIRIGSVTSDTKNVLVVDGEETVIEPRGYEHFI